MVQSFLASTETRRLVRTDSSAGRPRRSTLTQLLNYDRSSARHCSTYSRFLRAKAWCILTQTPSAFPAIAGVNDSQCGFVWFSVALRPQRRVGPIRDGDRVGRGRENERLDRGNRPKKTGETVDRCQNNGSVKAVSPRHCPATCALRNCSFNCCAGQNH